MKEATPVVVLSSGGKDSLYMIDCLRRDDRWRIEAVVTTVNEANGRVAMHGTPGDLLRAQADALDLPLSLIELPVACDNETYISRLESGLAELRGAGAAHVACGDLFLADIRQWRETTFARMGWEPVFPIWHTPTDQLARTLAGPGWEVVVTCVDTAVLDDALLGQRLDAAFLDHLPDAVDPCGENGEFHTFVCNAPGFRRRIEVRTGKRHLAHDRYLMVDLLAR